MQINDRVSINLAAVLTTNGSMISAWAGGDIVAITEKAIKLQAVTESGKEISCWFPRKALKIFGEPRSNPFDNQISHCCTLARWFKLDGWSARFIELSGERSVLQGAA